jgi:arsenate reductase
MKKIRVLFVCEHNSARSQMAEAFLNEIAGEKYQAESGGLEPGELNPLVVEVMKEVGIDISTKKTKSVFDLYKRGEFFSYVITVCDPASAQRCPIFPGTLSRIDWSFDNPSAFTGDPQARLAKTRAVRDAIRVKVEEFVGNPKQ